jgi:hypothetical protein
MNIIKVRWYSEVSVNYTGVAENWNGDRCWFLKGKLHRIDGPAIEFKNGDKSWYLNGIEYSQEEWFERLSEEDKEKAVWNLR